MIFEQLKDFMTIILAVASVASFAIQDFKAGSTLFAVIVINVIIGFVQEYKADKAINALMNMEVQRGFFSRLLPAPCFFFCPSCCSEGHS